MGSNPGSNGNPSTPHPAPSPAPAEPAMAGPSGPSENRGPSGPPSPPGASPAPNTQAAAGPSQAATPNNQANNTADKKRSAGAPGTSNNKKQKPDMSRIEKAIIRDMTKCGDPDKVNTNGLFASAGRTYGESLFIIRNGKCFKCLNAKHADTDACMEPTASFESKNLNRAYATARSKMVEDLKAGKGL